jgi:chromosome transmission fidelity protein 18
LKDLLSRALGSNTIDSIHRATPSLDQLTKPSNNSLRPKRLSSALPNCIILDEIDGIDNSATIDMLVSIISNPLPIKTDKDKKQFESDEKTSSEPHRKTSKNNPKIPVLTRPLICICNDHYAPNLRGLKKFVKLFIFPTPREFNLTNRLKTICQMEKISIQPYLLTELCKTSGYDIRSALNTLQFASIHFESQQQPVASSNSKTNKKDVSNSISDISRSLSSMMTIGLKDMKKDIYQIWNEIFSGQEMKKSIEMRFQSM